MPGDLVFNFVVQTLIISAYIKPVNIISEDNQWQSLLARWLDIISYGEDIVLATR